jgi:hypothetical protein
MTFRGAPRSRFDPALAFVGLARLGVAFKAQKKFKRLQERQVRQKDRKATFKDKYLKLKAEKISLDSKYSKLKAEKTSLDSKYAKLEAKILSAQERLEAQKAYLHVLVGQLDGLRAIKKKSDSYVEMATMLYYSYQALLSPYWSPTHQILCDGLANLFTAKMLHDDDQYFLKVVKPKWDAERCFYALLLKDAISPSGYFFSFSKPLAIADQDYARAYVFPFLNTMSSLYTLENIDLAISAMAEMNAASSSEQVLCSSGLSRMNPNLADSSLQQVIRYSLFKDKEEEQLALRRHEEVLSRWEIVACNFRSLKSSLCSNDSHFENAAFIDGKYFFLDMGRAQISPLGVETFWLMQKCTKTVKNEAILLKYISVLKSLGILVSLEEVQLAVYVAVAKKWLNVRAKVRSTHQVKNYLYALKCAEFCLKVCDA